MDLKETLDIMDVVQKQLAQTSRKWSFLHRPFAAFP